MKLLTEYDEEKFLEQEREVWKEEGITQGMQQMSQIIQYLINHAREQEIPRALEDSSFQEVLLQEAGVE